MPLFFRQIARVKDSDIFPAVVIGNKCDLEYDREVESEEGKKFAIERKFSFFEASAKNFINIQESFVELVRAMRLHRGKNTPVSSNSGEGRRPRKLCVLL
jgi:GTPase KRas protein